MRVINNVIAPPPAPVTGPFATEAVLTEEQRDGSTYTGTSQNTSALFQSQGWNVQGRYTWEAYGLDSRITLTELVGGDWTFVNVSAPSGVYTFNARVWDNVAASLIYDTASDGSVNPQITIP